MNIKISPGLLLKQNEIDNSNMFCKFQLHCMQKFLKLATENVKKTEKLHPHPHPLTLTA